MHLLTAPALCPVPLWLCRMTPVSCWDVGVMSPTAGRMPGTQAVSVLQGWGVRPARAAVLCVFGVGHLVTHNLIKIHGTSKAPRVTEGISAAADLWGKPLPFPQTWATFSRFQAKLFLTLHQKRVYFLHNYSHISQGRIWLFLDAAMIPWAWS